jgi:hypothetical protein
VPAEAFIHINVIDCPVTLIAEGSYQFPSDAAYHVGSGSFGVIGVTNEIRVVTP